MVGLLVDSGTSAREAGRLLVKFESEKGLFKGGRYPDVDEVSFVETIKLWSV